MVCPMMVALDDVVTRILLRRNGCPPELRLLGMMAPPPIVGLRAKALRGDEHMGTEFPLVGMLFIAFSDSTNWL